MNAVNQVFNGIPSMVCRWHMNKNVVAKTRQVLGQIPVESPAPGQPKYENTWQTSAFLAVFYRAVDAETEEEFELRRNDLHELNAYLASYLDQHWWKYKTRIVRYWTNCYRHFGIRDTSVVEGTHAKCKRWLKNSRGDLYTVFKSLLPWWNIAAMDTTLTAERNATITPYKLQASRYAAVVRIIAVYALNETDILWTAATKIVFNRIKKSACSGSFRRQHGRPCLHDLIEIVESNGSTRLAPENYSAHWWINREQERHLPARVQEPATIRTTRVSARRLTSHRSGDGLNSTRRDPIFSERVDRNNPATPPRIRTDSSPGSLALPPLRIILTRSTVFHDNCVPARSWGYAGQQ